MTSESPGTLIGSYEIIQRLEGHASEVYLARRHGEEEPSRRFLLVLFEVRMEDAEMISAEVERCKSLDHPAIVRVVEMFEHGSKHVLVFDSVPGTNLHRLIQHLGEQGERLADRAVYHVGHALFAALSEAHLAKNEEGKTSAIVHGQLGPHMVLVSWRGAVTILGFGMSRVFRLAESLLAEADDLRPFMAPEMRAGYAPTPRANVYSIAAMLWSLFTQKLPPTDGTKAESLTKLRSDLPRSVSNALDQALEPAVTQRNISCRELAGVFERLAGSEGRRELRWNMDVFKELDHVDAGVIPPESLPPSKLSDVTELTSVPPESDPVSGAEALLSEENWKVADGAGSYAIIGGRRLAPGSRDSVPSEGGDSIPLSDSAVPTPRVAERALAGAVAAKKDADKKKTEGQKIGRVPTLSGIKAGGRRPKKATLVGTGMAATRGAKDTEGAKPDAVAKQDATPAPRQAAAKKTPATGTVRTTLRSTKPMMAAAGAAEPSPGKRDEASKPDAASPKPGAAKAKQADKPAPRPDKGKPSLEALAAPLAEAAGSPAPLNLDAPPQEPVELPKAPLTPALPGVAPKPIEDLPTDSEDFEDEPTQKFTREALRPFAPGQGTQSSAPADALEEPYDLPPVTPSLRPAALADSAFVAPSLHPPPVEGGAVAGDALPLSIRPAHRAIAVTGITAVAKRSLASLPVKWTVAVAVTAIASFVAGLLVASGPVKVSVGDDPRPSDTAPRPTTAAQPDPSSAATAQPTAPPAAAVQAPSANPSAATPAPVVDDGKDGSDLPTYEGYLIVHSPARIDDVYVYVIGRPMGPPEEKLRVPCGLINVRLGTEPLRVWYGRGRAVRVACQSVTEFDFAAPEPMSPTAPPGPAGPAVGGPRDDRYWIPPSL